MELTQEQKRIKIAEVCGWYRSDDDLQTQSWRHPLNLHHTTCLPNYFFDLNSSAEMRETLTTEKMKEFFFQLSVECGASGDFMRRPVEIIKIINATPAQHCEAFGLTLGLWEKTPNESSSATTRRWRGGCASCRRASFEAFAAAPG